MGRFGGSSRDGISCIGILREPGQSQRDGLVCIYTYAQACPFLSLARSLVRLSVRFDFEGGMRHVLALTCSRFYEYNAVY